LCARGFGYDRSTSGDRSAPAGCFDPVARVGADVTADVREGTVVTDDPLVIVTLPEPPAETRPAMIGHGVAIARGGEGFDVLYDVRQRDFAWRRFARDDVNDAIRHIA
jgi:hypothetical protein